jgi:hypothetical protein
VRDEVARMVFSWTQWQQMLLQMRHGLIPVQEDRAEGKKKPGSIFGSDDEEELGPELPQQTEAFLPLFQQTLERCDWFSRLAVQNAIAGLTTDLDDTLSSVRDDLRPLWKTPGRKELVEQMGGRPARIFLSRLESATELQGAVQNLVKQFSTADGEILLRGRARDSFGELARSAHLHFPLAQPSGKHTIGRRLPWAKQGAASDNHQLLMLRLREALTASATQATTQQVSQLGHKVLSDLIGACQDLYKQLVQARSNPAIMGALSHSSGPSNPSAGVGPYAALASIRRPNLPDK